MGRKKDEKESKIKKVLLCLFLSITIIALINNYTKDKYIYIIDKTERNNTKEFAELKELAKNITQEMRSFFKFNMSNIDAQYNEEYLKKYGGVCWHYSEYSYKKGIKEGFYSQKIIIDTNETRRHQFTIISNEKGYCVIEQTNYHCFKLVI